MERSQLLNVLAGNWTEPGGGGASPVSCWIPQLQAWGIGSRVGVAIAQRRMLGKESLDFIRAREMALMERTRGSSGG